MSTRERHRLAAQQRLGELQHVADAAGDMHRMDVEPHAALADAVEVEQVVDQARQPARARR